LKICFSYELTDEKNSEHSNDILDYIKIILESKTKLISADLEYAIDIIFKKTEGKFIYLRSVNEQMDDLARDSIQSIEEVFQILKALPQGLYDSYDMNFSRIKKNFSDEKSKLKILVAGFKFFLSIIVASYEPLSLTEVQDIFQSANNLIDQ
jgi:hypothetical protein